MSGFMLRDYECRASTVFASHGGPKWPRRESTAGSRIRRFVVSESATVATDAGIDEMITQANPLKSIVSTPGVCGGDACVRNTRIAVWLLQHRRMMNHSIDQIVLSFPFLTKADIQAAFEYADLHASEINEQIRENTED